MKSKSSDEPLMDDNPACLFGDELDRLVDRYRFLPIGSIVGTLTIKAHYLCTEAACRDVLAQERE